VLLNAGVGRKHRCLALLVVGVQLVGAVSKVMSEDYKIKDEKDGQPVHITILSYVSLSVDCCSSMVLVISTYNSTSTLQLQQLYHEFNTNATHKNAADIIPPT